MSPRTGLSTRASSLSSTAASGDGESRGLPRVGADFPVDLRTSDLSSALPARARDLGVGGVCVATASPFSLKSVRRVAIALPDQTLTLEAEGRWQREARGDDCILTGIEFSRPPDAAVRTLWDFVLDAGKEIARFLDTASDLRGLGVEDSMGLAHLTRLRDVPAGRWLYAQETQRDGEDSVFVVLRGSVGLHVRVRNARDVNLSRLGPGALIGGLALLSGAPHWESAVAASDTRLLEIDRAAFHHLERTKPQLARRLAHGILQTHATRLQSLLTRTTRDLT